MKHHAIVKTALGVGLMAASLSASAAALHTFTQPSIYYKTEGAKVNYVAFIPSGTLAYQGGNGVVMLELYNSGTISTWNYAVAAKPTNATDAGAGWTNLSGSVIGSAGPVSMSAVNYPISSVAAGYITMAQDFWSLGQTGAISAAFAQPQTISSVACNVTFQALANTDDYLVFTNFTIRPDTWQTSAVANVSYKKASSGALTAGTSSIGSVAWNAANFSASSSFPTFSAYSLTAGTGSVAETIAASNLTKANLCTSVYTAKNALNSSGTTIGGKAGMMRLW